MLESDTSSDVNWAPNAWNLVQYLHFEKWWHVLGRQPINSVEIKALVVVITITSND